MARILIADDERDLRRSVAEVLTEAGHQVDEADTTDDALARLKRSTYHVVLSDLRMPGSGGLEVLREAARRMPDVILLVLTAHGSLDSAVEALRIGAHDFLLKPLNLEALVRKVALLLKHQAALAENRFLRGALSPDLPSTGLVGSSPAIERVKRLIGKVAPTDSTVLIHGETGCGKELVAHALHRSSPRGDQPFVAVNCGSIPETLLESELFGHVRGAFTGAERDKRGLFEVAGSGTIFLDEIGELPLALQPKLLRTLESREVLPVGSTTPLRIAARIVAATHRELLRMVEEGQFRRDLYYRLNVFEIAVPPLRERLSDLPAVALHLMERICRRMNRPLPAFEPSALALLESYAWPGNVRELANVLERALILAEGPRIGPAELPGLGNAGATPAGERLKDARDAFERAHLEKVIANCGGDKRKAAEILDINLSSLYRKLERGDE